MVEVNRAAKNDVEREPEIDGRLLRLSRRQVGIALAAVVLHAPILAWLWNRGTSAIRYRFDGPFPLGEMFVVKASDDVPESPIRRACISVSPSTGFCSFGFVFRTERQSGKRIEVVVDAKGNRGQILHTFSGECTDVRNTSSRIVKGIRVPAVKSPGKSVSGSFPESLISEIRLVDVSIYSVEGDS